MSILSVTRFRTLGPGAAMPAPVVSDEVVQFYIDAAEGEAKGYLGARGYERAIATAGPDFELAIIKMVAHDIFVLNVGQSPDPEAHKTLAKARDTAIAWFEKVAAGDSNLGPGAPERKKTRAAEVIAGDDGCSTTRGY